MYVGFSIERFLFITSDRVLLTYTPFEVLGADGLPRTTFAVYMAPEKHENNPLCSYVLNLSDRRKRSPLFNSGLAASGLTLSESIANALPQELITDVIRSAIDDINQEMMECCDTTITEVREAELEQEPEVPVDNNNEGWCTGRVRYAYAKTRSKNKSYIRRRNLKTCTSRQVF